MIGIVDYGLGNLTSVAGAVERLGHDAVISGDPSDLERTDKIIIPGVGAFGDGMRNLRDRGLVEPLRRMVVSEGRPTLGICLGFQLLAQDSEEFGEHEGLGWIKGRVRKLSPGDHDLRVPHVGWNDLIRSGDSPLLANVPEDALFYYVHSYYLDAADDDIVVGECDYGSRFAAAIQKGTLWGTQFHPEKSQEHGLTVLGNFLDQA